MPLPNPFPDVKIQEYFSKNQRWPLLLPALIPFVVFPVITLYRELTPNETLFDPDFKYWSGIVFLAAAAAFLCVLIPYRHTHPHCRRRLIKLRFWKRLIKRGRRRLIKRGIVALLGAAIGTVLVLVSKPEPLAGKIGVAVLRLQGTDGKERSRGILDRLGMLVRESGDRIQPLDCIGRTARSAQFDSAREQAIEIATLGYYSDFVIWNTVLDPLMTIAREPRRQGPRKGLQSSVEPRDIPIRLGKEGGLDESTGTELLNIVQGLRFYGDGELDQARLYFHDSESPVGTVYEGLCYYGMALNADSKGNVDEAKENLRRATGAYESVIANMPNAPGKEDTRTLVAALINAANAGTELAARAGTVEERLKYFKDAEKYYNDALTRAADYLTGERKGGSVESHDALKAELYRWEYRINLGSLYLDWSRTEDGLESRTRLGAATKAFTAAKSDLQALRKIDKTAQQAELLERDLIIANNGLATALSGLAWPGEGKQGRDYLEPLRSTVKDLNDLLFSGAHEELKEVRGAIELDLAGALTTLAHADDCKLAGTDIREAIFHYRNVTSSSTFPDAKDDGGAEAELASALSLLADFADPNEKEALLAEAVSLLAKLPEPRKSDGLTLDRLALVKRKVGVLQQNRALLDEAESLARKAVDAEQDTGSQYDLAWSYNTLATILSEKAAIAGNASVLGEAVRGYESALQIWTKEVYPGEFAAAKAGLGMALTQRAALERNPILLAQAQDAYGEALSVYGDGDWRERVGALNRRARASRILSELSSGDGRLKYLLSALTDIDGAMSVLEKRPDYPTERTTQVKGLTGAARENGKTFASGHNEAYLRDAMNEIDQAIRIISQDACYSGSRALE
jgi:hypothetical protein